MAEQRPSHFDSADGRTHAMPFCEVCPPLWDWPYRNLILGMCPRCGRSPQRNVARILRAKRLIEESR